MFSKKNIILLSAIVNFLFFEGFLLYYKAGFIWLTLILLVTMFVVWVSIVDVIFSKNYFYYLITPLIFIFAIFSIIILSESDLLKQSMLIVYSVLYWLYFVSVYLFNFDFDKYNKNSIENISSYINLISFFLISSSLYAGFALIGLSFWIATIIILIMVSGLLIQSLWIAGFKTLKNYIYLLVINLVIIEVFWSLAFLPTNFYVNGFFLTISYYLSWGLFKSNLHNILTKKVVKRYLIITCIVILLVVFSTTWI